MKVTVKPSTKPSTRARMRREAEDILGWATQLHRRQRASAFHADYVEKLAKDVLTLLDDVEGQDQKGPEDATGGM